MAKLCQYLIRKPKRLTADSCCKNFAHTHDKNSKASLYAHKRSGKNVTIMRQQKLLVAVVESYNFFEIPRIMSFAFFCRIPPHGETLHGFLTGARYNR